MGCSVATRARWRNRHRFRVARRRAATSGAQPRTYCEASDLDHPATSLGPGERNRDRTIWDFPPKNWKRARLPTPRLISERETIPPSGDRATTLFPQFALREGYPPRGSAVAA